MTAISVRSLTLPLAAVAALGLGLPAATSVASAESQPRMENARNNLMQARRDLQRASRDKGGHRVRAIRLIDQALAEVRGGIRYDNRNYNWRERRREFNWRTRR